MMGAGPAVSSAQMLPVFFVFFIALAVRFLVVVAFFVFVARFFVTVRRGRFVVRFLVDAARFRFVAVGIGLAGLPTRMGAMK
jgi:hypothetical protein